MMSTAENDDKPLLYVANKPENNVINPESDAITVKNVISTAENGVETIKSTYSELPS